MFSELSQSNLLIGLVVALMVLGVIYLVFRQVQTLQEQVRIQKTQIKQLKHQMVHGVITSSSLAQIGYIPEDIETPEADPFPIYDENVNKGSWWSPDQPFLVPSSNEAERLPDGELEHPSEVEQKSEEQVVTQTEPESEENPDGESIPEPEPKPEPELESELKLEPDSDQPKEDSEQSSAEVKSEPSEEVKSEISEESKSDQDSSQDPENREETSTPESELSEGFSSNQTLGVATTLINSAMMVEHPNSPVRPKLRLTIKREPKPKRT